MKNKIKFTKILDWVTVVLACVGGLTWGTVGLPQLLGFAGFNVVTALISEPRLVNAVFSLVGLSTLWIIIRGLMGNFMK